MDISDIKLTNPHLIAWMRTYNAMRGLDLSCRYATFTEADLPDTCPQCKERCELDGEPICYECKIDPSRGKENESEDCEEEVCECCGGTGTIYVMHRDSYYGMREVPVRCHCGFPSLLSYNVRQLAIDELSGLNWV